MLTRAVGGGTVTMPRPSVLPGPSRLTCVEPADSDEGPATDACGAVAGGVGGADVFGRLMRIVRPDAVAAGGGIKVFSG